MVKKLHGGKKIGIYGYKICEESAVGQDIESMIIFMLKRKRPNDINFLNRETNGSLFKDVVLTDEEKENFGFFLFCNFAKVENFQITTDVSPL